MTNLSPSDPCNPRNCYGTPWEVFNAINVFYNCALDVCAEPWSAKCGDYITIEQDALKVSWCERLRKQARPGACFLNPPYHHKLVGAFLAKAFAESREGARVVCLLPNSTDVKWYHNWVAGKASEVRFLPGRIDFIPPPGADLKVSGAKRGHMVVVYG